MRREFILVLLGIICVSTLSSLISDYVHIDTIRILLDTVAGVVGAGNFSYWQLGHSGPLLIELTSTYGDADLYVSDNVRPSYEIDKYNFSSTTCGLDVIAIPADFPRPIGIGVFGHWSHAQSEYYIRVFLDTSAILSSDHFIPAESLSNRNAASEERQRKEKQPARHSDEETKPRFMRLLNILDMILEMFIL